MSGRRPAKPARGRFGRPYTAEEDAAIWAAMGRHGALAEVAQRFGRSRAGVSRRADVLRNCAAAEKKAPAAMRCLRCKETFLSEDKRANRLCWVCRNCNRDYGAQFEGCAL